MTKKFKTVSGYLRSMETDLCYQQQMAKLNGRPAISDDEGQRQIINNLLQQLGIGGQIEQAEKPHDAIRRLRQSAQSETQTKALDACLKWLRTFEVSF